LQNEECALCTHWVFVLQSISRGGEESVGVSAAAESGGGEDVDRRVDRGGGGQQGWRAMERRVGFSKEEANGGNSSSSSSSSGLQKARGGGGTLWFGTFVDGVRVCLCLRFVFVLRVLLHFLEKGLHVHVCR
jgi:hypothetical protein